METYEPKGVRIVKQVSQVFLTIMTLAFPLLSGCNINNSPSETGQNTSENRPQSWESLLEQRLPLMGHRNFIVVADSAYPQQSNPGITTVYTGASQQAVVSKVLAAVDAAGHVQGMVYLDEELSSVSEDDAPGIKAYRSELEKVLDDRIVTRLPHMEIIKKLDASGELFNVLILKTDLTLPYTSVFVELDCGYWNAEREQRLRSTVKDE